MQPQEPQPESAGPFPVYLPHDGSPISRIVLQRSALVGFPLEFKPELVRIFFEGNRFNVEALRRYADRVKHAAGRCRWFRFDAASWSKEYPGQPPPQVERGYAIYPTSAQSVVPVSNLILVASYDDWLGIVTPTDAEADLRIRRWIGSTEAAEYRATGEIYEQRRRALGGSGGQSSPQGP